LRELVQMFAARPALSPHRCFNTCNHTEMAVQSLLPTLYH